MTFDRLFTLVSLPLRNLLHECCCINFIVAIRPRLVIKALQNLKALSYLALVTAVLVFLTSAGRAENIATVADFVSKLSIHSSGSLGDLAVNTAEGDFPTFPVTAGEKLEIALSVPAAIVGKVIQIRADNGGNIQGGEENGKTFSVVSDGKEGLLKLTYILAGAKGRYNLKIVAPGFSQTLEFWVGPLPPTGQPGPALHFSAPKTTPEITVP